MKVTLSRAVHRYTPGLQRCLLSTFRKRTTVFEWVLLPALLGMQLQYKLLLEEQMTVLPLEGLGGGLNHPAFLEATFVPYQPPVLVKLMKDW